VDAGPAAAAGGRRPGGPDVRKPSGPTLNFATEPAIRPSVGPRGEASAAASQTRRRALAGTGPRVP